MGPLKLYKVEWSIPLFFCTKGVVKGKFGQLFSSKYISSIFSDSL